MLEPVRGLTARRALLGVDLEPVENAWMTFENGVISGLGTGRGPAGLTSLGDVVVMPGLVDCHVHLTMDGGCDIEAAMAGLTRESAVELARRNAAAQVASGVTTVRDLGSFEHTMVDRAADFSGAAVAPSVVAAGAVSRPGGHGHFIATPAQDAEGYAAATRALIARGARAVKIFATGGVITRGSGPGGRQMSDEELRAVVEAAHSAQVPVAAHAHAAEGIAAAVRAGVDSVEHFSYLADLDMRQVHRTGTCFVSTLVATERFVRSPHRHNSPAETLDKITVHAPHERAALRLAVRERLRLAAGTDAGTTFNPHGWGMQDQAELLSAAGCPGPAILRCLTVAGARLLGEPAGWLGPGRRADVVALAGDPLTDVGALRQVREVVIRGQRLGPAG
jgi:imidazolonepropionase-like amidohydrolase